jgi:hypothetical protein
MSTHPRTVAETKAKFSVLSYKANTGDAKKIPNHGWPTAMVAAAEAWNARRGAKALGPVPSPLRGSGLKIRLSSRKAFLQPKQLSRRQQIKA